MTTTITANNYPTRATMYHDESTVLTGGAIAITLDTSQSYNIYVTQATPSNGDSFTQSFFIRAGTYTLTVLGETQSSAGKIDWYIDGVITGVTAQDWYSASTTRNIKKTGSVTIASDGYHVLKGLVNGKNASSLGYAIPITIIYLSAAAD